MTSSDQDSIASTAKGVTEGILSFGKEQIKEWIRKFKERSLAFIEDKETIDLAKEQRITGEWEFFKKYVKDNDSRVLFQLGLSLRQLEKEKKDIEPLKKRIIKKYNYNGLRVAHFVQNGLLNRYFGIILEKSSTTEKLTTAIEELFRDIDKHAAFIQSSDQEHSEAKANEIIAKIRATSPQTFVISSSKSAMEICENIVKKVAAQLPNYTSEHYQATSKMRKVFFLIREEENLAED